MKLKNLLLMIAVLTVLFVGCARQRTVTPPRVTPQVTPQSTTLDTPRITPGLPNADISPGTDSTVRRETGMGTGTGTEAGTKASTGGSIENGTFNGDLYISSNNFRLINSTVRGNVYFTTVKARSTFKMDANSKITGRQELMR